MRTALTVTLVAFAVMTVVVGDATVAAIVTGVGLFAWVAVRRGGLIRGRPRGVPDPPVVEHVPGCPSGVYTFELWSTGKTTDPVAIKAGKSGDLQRRMSNYVTLEDRRIMHERILRTPDYHQLEDRIRADLLPWRLGTGEQHAQRARELYEPCDEVRWYLHTLFEQARGIRR